MKTSDQTVELLYYSGDNLSVVNAARVSFHKVSTELTNKDIKLINYLAKHNHWTPFAHNSLTFRIKAPVFVARQLGKHQVGLVWNEVSRRYVEDEPEFYLPEVWRGKPENAKQGSSGVVKLKFSRGFDPDGLEDTPFEMCHTYLNYYTELLAQGVAPEQARMLLPQNMMTEWIWTGSLAAFSRVCKLRLDSHTQQETQGIAQGINDAIPEAFSHSWKALQENDTE